MKQLKDVFSPITSKNLFRSLYLKGAPWSLENSTLLDGLAISDDELSEYINNLWGFSHGEKYISPYMDKVAAMFPNDDDKPLMYDWVATQLLIKYRHKWAKELATMELKYNPIENYSMIEKGTDNRLTSNTNKGTTDSETTDSTSTLVGDTQTHYIDKQPPITHAVDGREYEEKTSAYNSDDYVPLNLKTEDAHKEVTYYGLVEKDGTYVEGTREGKSRDIAQQNSDTAQKTKSSNTAETSANGAETTDHTFTRSGNIGVTTSQQMLESERALWLWDYFEDIVFSDINKMLTIKIY